LLNPGAGKIVQRTQVPLYCGAIFGRCFGYTEHPNKIDANKTSIRFAGQFVGIKADGSTSNTVEAYLPSTVERGLKAALDVQKGTAMSAPVEFSVEVWCEPDPRPQSILGFRYASYDRKPQVENDPLFALGVASGLIEDTRKQLTGPSAGDVDPETGEVREAA
jgi:hypothetical protein